MPLIYNDYDDLIRSYLMIRQNCALYLRIRNRRKLLQNRKKNVFFSSAFSFIIQSSLLLSMIMENKKLYSVFEYISMIFIEKFSNFSTFFIIIVYSTQLKSFNYERKKNSFFVVFSSLLLFASTLPSTMLSLSRCVDIFMYRRT